MIFKNEISYIIKDKTRNNTNTKDYMSLVGDYIYESTFKYEPKNDGKNHESCVLGRSGFNFGIYTYESEDIRQKENQFNNINNTIKWVWFREEDGQILYDDIFFGFNPDDVGYLEHLSWWKRYIDKECPLKINDDLIDLIAKRWGFFDGTFKANDIDNPILFEWINKVEEGRNRTGSYITDVVNVSVIKNGEWFELYVNDVFYRKKPTGNLVNNNDKTLCVGIGDPYRLDDNKMFFNGEIFEIKIYNSSEKNKNSLYCWVDFSKYTHFKIFDKSLHGNHLELFETEDHKNKKNIEFNQFSRPAKIL